MEGLIVGSGPATPRVSGAGFGPTPDTPRDQQQQEHFTGGAAVLGYETGTATAESSSSSSGGSGNGGSNGGPSASAVRFAILPMPAPAPPPAVALARPAPARPVAAQPQKPLQVLGTAPTGSGGGGGAGGGGSSGSAHSSTTMAVPHFALPAGNSDAWTLATVVTAARWVEELAGWVWAHQRMQRRAELQLRLIAWPQQVLHGAVAVLLMTITAWCPLQPDILVPACTALGALAALVGVLGVVTTRLHAETDAVMHTRAAEEFSSLRSRIFHIMRLGSLRPRPCELYLRSWYQEYERLTHAYHKTLPMWVWDEFRRTFAAAFSTGMAAPPASSVPCRVMFDVDEPQALQKSTLAILPPDGGAAGGSGAIAIHVAAAGTSENPTTALMTL